MKVDKTEILEMHKENILEILTQNQDEQVAAHKIAEYVCSKISRIIRIERTKNTNDYLTMSRFYGGENNNERKTTHPNRATRK